MKKYLPISSSLLLLAISIIFWDSIKLPYDESNVIVGQPFYNKFNPINDKIRFLFFYYTFGFNLFILLFKGKYKYFSDLI